MKLPRDLTGDGLAKKLKVLGDAITRQAGSHTRLTTTVDDEFHGTIPAHDPLEVGALSAILNAIASHHKISKEELLQKLA